MEPGLEEARLGHCSVSKDTITHLSLSCYALERPFALPCLRNRTQEQDKRNCYKRLFCENISDNISVSDVIHKQTQISILYPNGNYIFMMRWWRWKFPFFAWLWKFLNVYAFKFAFQFLIFWLITENFYMFSDSFGG